MASSGGVPRDDEAHRWRLIDAIGASCEVKYLLNGITPLNVTMSIAVERSRSAIGSRRQTVAHYIHMATLIIFAKPVLRHQGLSSMSRLQRIRLLTTPGAANSALLLAGYATSSMYFFTSVMAHRQALATSDDTSSIKLSIKFQSFRVSFTK